VYLILFNSGRNTREILSMQKIIITFRDKDGYLLETQLDRVVDSGDLYIDFGGHKCLVLDVQPYGKPSLVDDYMDETRPDNGD
jgi:hypothetical protein